MLAEEVIIFNITIVVTLGDIESHSKTLSLPHCRTYPVFVLQQPPCLQNLSVHIELHLHCRE